MHCLYNPKAPRVLAAAFFLSASFFILHAESETIPASEAAGRLGARFFWDPLSEICVFNKDGHYAQLRANEGLALFDYASLVFIDAPLVQNGELVFTSSAVSALDAFFSSAPQSVNFRVGAILLDPGHGGRDAGAIGEYTGKDGKTQKCVEKDVTLSVSRRLCELLTRAYPDKKILTTRGDDSYPTLEERVEIANSVPLASNEAILYISIHANAAFNKSASGFEVWYLSQDYRRKVIDDGDLESKEIAAILNSMMEEEFTTESILIAKFILDELAAQIGAEANNRGLKEEEWFVVRNARMPSVLIELGFVSNPAEAERLNDPSYLQKAAVGIYNGLVKFIDYFEHSGGFTTAQ